MRVAGVSDATLNYASFEHTVEVLRRVDGVRLVTLSGIRGTRPAGGAPRADFAGRRSELKPGLRAADAILNDAGARIAADIGVYTVTGPSLELAGGERYIVARLWGPDGSLVGVQRQTHLSRFEREHGLARGDEITLFDIDGISLGVVVGNDAWHPEVGRIMALRGVDLVAAVGVGVAAGETMPKEITPNGAGRNTWAPSVALRWGAIDALWAQVQENQFWAVASGSHSVVLAPCEITAGMTGYLSCGRAVNDGQPSFAVGELDDDARDRLIAHYPLLGLLNPVAYRRYLPALYGGEAEEGRR